MSAGPPKRETLAGQGEGRNPDHSTTNAGNLAEKTAEIKWWRCVHCRALSADNLIDPRNPQCSACGHRAELADLRAEREARARGRT